MYMEIGLIIVGIALLVLVLFCIPVLMKLSRVASDVTITLRTLNERLPEILKNMEDISANINSSTTAINGEVQKYAATAGRFHLALNKMAGGLELISPLALKSSLFRKMIVMIPVIKGVRVFLDVWTGKQKN